MEKNEHGKTERKCKGETVAEVGSSCKCTWGGIIIG